MALDYIPTYAFCDKTVNIEKNNSVFDNDYMTLRLTQITVASIKNNIAYLPDKYWKGVEYSDPDRERHPDDSKHIELYVNGKNTTKEVMNVTTNNVKVFEDGHEVPGKFNEKFPCLIIQLRPEETFTSRSVAVLGIGKNNNIWSSVATAYYDEMDNGKLKLTLESQGQMDEYEILHKACTVMKEKVKLIKTHIQDKYESSEIKEGNSLKLVLENEDHTLGEIINEALQNNKNVSFSGVSKPYFMVDKIIITFQTANKNPLNPLYVSLDHVTELFSIIQTQIEKMGSKWINYDYKKTK